MADNKIQLDYSGAEINGILKSIKDNTFKPNNATKADSATKATGDGSGNTISSTYLKKTDAEKDYLKKTDAEGTDGYLKKSIAESDYLKTADADNKYMTKNGDGLDYLPAEYDETTNSYHIDKPLFHLLS